MTLGGGQLTIRPVALTADGRHLLACCHTCIQVFDCNTEACCQTLRGHTGVVTRVLPYPGDEKRVISCSLDQTIKVWDRSSGECLSTHKVRGPVEDMAISPLSQKVYLALHKTTVGGKHAGNIRSRALEALDQELPGKIVTRQAGVLTMSSSGRLAAAVDVRSLWVWRCGGNFSKLRPLNLVHSKIYTCAAISNDDETVAAGDVTGRIVVWYKVQRVLAEYEAAGEDLDLNDVSKRKEWLPSQTTYHWHSQPVMSLQFSQDDVYLMSGGHEAVLVLWKLSSGSQNFLPRLGAAVRQILPDTADPGRFCITLGDNTIRLVNLGSYTIDRSIYGIRPPVRGVPLPAQALATVLDPSSGHLVVPGDNTVLQWYDVTEDHHRGKLQVTPRNYVTANEGAVPLIPWVTHVAFSPTGDTMVTVDIRPDAGGLGSVESSLKFWHRTPDSPHPGHVPPLKVNTHIDDPHGEAQVTSVAYHPREAMVATTSNSGECRLWRCRSVEKTPGAGGPSHHRRWHLDSVWTYNQHYLHCCCFSGDGSILAVGAEGMVVLWNARTGAVVDILPGPAGSNPLALQSLSFVGGTPFLLGLSHPQDGQCLVVVWSILTAGLLWSILAPCSAVAVDEVNEQFAVSLSKRGPDGTGYVLVFDPTSPSPHHVIRVPHLVPVHMAFAPKASPLYEVCKDLAPPGLGVLVLVGEARETMVATLKNIKKKGIQRQEKPGAPVPQLVEMAAATESNPKRSEVIIRPIADNKKQLQKLFDVPSHVLPPPTVLYANVLETLLIDIQ